MCSCGMCTSCFDPYCRWNRWLWKTLMASCPPMSTARCLSTPSWQPLQWWSFSFGPCYVFDGGRSCSTSTWSSAACASSPSLKVWRGSCTFSAGMKEVWRVRPCFLDDDLWFSHFYNKNLRHVKFTDLCFAGVFDRFIHQLAPRFSVSSRSLMGAPFAEWFLFQPSTFAWMWCGRWDTWMVVCPTETEPHVLLDAYGTGLVHHLFFLDPYHDCTKNGWTSVQ